MRFLYENWMVREENVQVIMISNLNIALALLSRAWGDRWRILVLIAPMCAASRGTASAPRHLRAMLITLAN